MKDIMEALPEAEREVIKEEMSTGHYSSEVDVLRIAVNLLKLRRQADGDLLMALTAGRESGVADDFDFDAFIEETDKLPS